MKRLLRVLFLCFVITMPTYANPIVIGPPSPFEPLLHFFLFGEALVISLMLTNHKFYLIRTLILWHIVTFLTFFLFSVVLTLLILVFPFFLFLVIPLEYIVIRYEAQIIQSFSRRKFFNKKPREMSYKEAFKISLIGNLVSIYMGLIALFKFIS